MSDYTKKDRWAAVIVVLMLTFFVILAKVTCDNLKSGSEVKANVPEKELDICSIHGAYREVIHRVWIDQPAYVEDVLFETEEFLRLDKMLEGDWEDTFYFWSEKDSIDYNTNWKYDPLCTEGGPDPLPKKSKPDKVSKQVGQIKVR